MYTPHQEKSCFPYMSTSPLAGGPTSYPILLPRGAGTKGDSGGWDLYPLTPSDDLLAPTPTLTSYTNKKWGEASEVCSTPFVPPLQSSASPGPGRCSRRKWKAFDALSLQLRGDEGHQSCFFWRIQESREVCSAISLPSVTSQQELGPLLLEAGPGSASMW